ncbi:hypothetical protein NL676_039304 [Syzygium grande]|nr:hypothetical protein NL676_039304 [Syzygium grande]
MTDDGDGLARDHKIGRESDATAGARLGKAHVGILELDSLTLVGWTGDLTTKKSPATTARDRQGQQLNYFVDGIKGSQSRGQQIVWSFVASSSMRRH